MTKEAAIEFFSELFFGEHHIPGGVKPFGSGWCVNSPHDMATFDYDALTRFVIMCHDKCIRGSVNPSGPGRLKIAIWQRYGREGSMCERHPTMEQAIEKTRKNYKR